MKKKKKKIRKIITLTTLIIMVLFIISISILNIVPTLYLIIGIIVILLLGYVVIRFNKSKKKGIRYLGYLISIIIDTLLVFILFYLFSTLGFLGSITNGSYSLNNYNVYVFKDSEYEDIKDLSGKKISIKENMNDNNTEKVKNNINKKVKVNYKELDDVNSILDSILNKEVDAIVLEENEYNLLKEENENANNLKSIYNIKIKKDIKDLISSVNINKESFNIYLTGIDTYGNINSTSRSDVNIVLTVNPKTEKILITWIPRDYYVNINKSSKKDKLTHAGMYGVDSSIYALENLLDIDINYYMKVNFTSVVKLVDLVGGVEVYNDETFTTNDNFTFKKGYVKLNGEEALSFVRDRKHVTGGDVGRGKNQIKVIEALIKKCKSPSILKNYPSILSSLDKSFVTNMSQMTMTSFIKKEISSKRDWEIDNMVLTGSDAYKTSYTYPNKELYVMIPNDDVVKEAKTKINETINNK